MHDYLTQRGGAERVVLSMLRAFPDAPLYTALYDPVATFPEFADYDIRPLWTNRIRSLRRDHRRGLMLYPFAFSGLRVDADVVLCSSSGFAHGARTSGRKVVYCYTPARWLYDQTDTYMAGWSGSVTKALRAVAPALRTWDRRAACSADAYLTSSQTVHERIRMTYGIDADVVPPPAPAAVTSDGGPPVYGIDPGFVLCVSRLLAYKNVAAVSEAFDHLPGARLVVVGEGPERPSLEATAGVGVSLLGKVTDLELAWLYANCAGTIAAAYEDFGLTALEAGLCGKPVAALRFGGYLDTVIEGKSGVFFDQPESLRIAQALREMFNQDWDGEWMKVHAAEFSESSFAGHLRTAMEVRTLNDAAA